MIKRSMILLVIAGFSIMLFYIGCSDSGTGPVDDGGGTVQVSISGIVLDEFNSPVAGAEVTLAGQSVMSNNSGTFIFSNISVPQNRFVVNAVKAGYFRGSYADVPPSGNSKDIRIYMISAGVAGSVNASAGGTVGIANGSSVELSANSIVTANGTDYTGSVNISLAYLDPTADNFSLLIPGSDMLAQRSDDSESTLYSYGIIKVEMKSDAGEKLQIKSGNTSTITVDIPASMETTAPQTIPLWYYDDAKGLWIEEGSATKQGDKYVGTVSHFSDWNCDVPERTATVKGLVLDCNNQPVPGIRVKIGQVSSLTRQDGTFERSVPTNTSFEVQVLSTQNFGLTSTPVMVPSLSAGQVYDVGTLSVDCPAYVKGSIKCGTDIKQGQVVISWEGGYNLQYTNAQGEFNLPTEIGKNAKVSIYTFDNKFKEVEITTPAVKGQILDLGTIEVCDQVQTGDNKFTLNGGGFNNQTFTFSGDTLLVYGYYEPEDSMSFIWMYQVFNTDTILFWMSFTGNTPGPKSEIVMWLYHNSNIYFGFDDDPGSALSVNVTNYGGLGGLIEGTFSGTLKDLIGGTGATVSVSNGQFSVIRVLSGGPERMLNKIPAEIRRKMPL